MANPIATTRATLSSTRQCPECKSTWVTQITDYLPEGKRETRNECRECGHVFGEAS